MIRSYSAQQLVYNAQSKEKKTINTTMKKGSWIKGFSRTEGVKSTLPPSQKQVSVEPLPHSSYTDIAMVIGYLPPPLINFYISLILSK